MNNIWENIEDGSNSTYFNWGSGDPIISNSISCIATDAQGFWYNVKCEQSNYFICGVPSNGNETETGSVPHP